uniref:WGS project CBMG000000000 data, contig CS5907-c003743 n=1 Tax=Fusarium acuminatum CS5907 TaxID=1318461 RepID=A0A090MGC2_9HYPO|nr:unnamed protein product [Fusarium acuminatum CS5907]
MSMLAAQISKSGSAPKAVRVLPPAAPIHESEVQIRVIATGLHQVTRSRAEGKHDTSTSFPHTPGIDGTGISISTGKLVYFTALTGTGSFAEIVNIPNSSVHELPPDVDPVQAAGLINPVMSSWMALRKRIDFLKGGQDPKPWACFILGATSMSGKLAIKVARLMGATRVIGAARNEDALRTLGLDDVIVLQDPPESTEFSHAADADVVLDYLYGPYFTNFFMSRSTLKATNPITWVCIESVAGNFGTVATAALRKRDVTIRGSGPGTWSFAEFEAEASGMLKVLEGVNEEGIRKVKLEDVETEWDSKDGGSVVFVLDEGPAPGFVSDVVA